MIVIQTIFWTVILIGIMVVIDKLMDRKGDL